jgi:hypothetical protein
MNLIERIKAPTPRKDKRQGKIATVISGLAETLALSGMFDNKPIILGLLHSIGVVAGAVAINKAQKTYEADEQGNEAR